MIIYSCSNCNDLECETSICPVCNNRTQIKKVKYIGVNIATFHYIIKYVLVAMKKQIT